MFTLLESLGAVFAAATAVAVAREVVHSLVRQPAPAYYLSNSNGVTVEFKAGKGIPTSLVFPGTGLYPAYFDTCTNNRHGADEAGSDEANAFRNALENGVCMAIW